MSDDNTPRSLPWIERLVSLDTTSRDSNLPLIETVSAEFRRHGIEPHVFPNADGSKANLVATVPAADGTTSGGVVLSGHTDVVPVDDQDWDSDPFVPEVRDGRVYGRGTADMKSFTAVGLTYLPEMVAAELREPIHFALTYDEEVGCLGGEEIVKQIADLGLAPRAAIVGEPTSMRVIRGHKSINLIRVEFTGVAAHSSLTSSGVNAIEYAAELITFVRSIADAWRADGPFDEAYPLAYSTASVNLIRGGIASNTVPEECFVELEFRGIAEIDPDEIIDRIRGKADELAERMRAENPAAGIEVKVLAKVPGLDTPGDSAAIALGDQLGAIPSEEKVTYGTEAGQFAGSGIETVVCGPGDIAQAHAANEYVALDQLVACERFVEKLIKVLSG
ncbi:acetylornithine deacetylase [Naumannella cuiyingiana]|uniref:Acetylornithine deacetylase n=1 Tax=Naumannella cuiyingiana TaxID=1347891 RepID=A0A7Z0D8W3_9ACTN|nr:acetylornithine deacetylase [Naumannella cuiyingiana]